MLAQPRGSVFREEVVRRRSESRREPALPRLGPPRVFLVLWVIVGLLVACGLLILTAATQAA